MNNRREWITAIPFTAISAIIVCAVVWLSYFFPDATIGGAIGHSDFWGNYPSSLHIVRGVSSYPPSSRQVSFSLACAFAFLISVICACGGFDRLGKTALALTWFGVIATVADILLFSAQ